MEFYASFDYVNPETGEVLIYKGSRFGLDTAHWLFAEYGIDQFATITAVSDVTILDGVPYAVDTFSFNA